MVEPGQSIPFDLYAAVAGILAYLYRQKVEERDAAGTTGRSRQRRQARSAGVASDAVGCVDLEVGCE